MNLGRWETPLGCNGWWCGVNWLLVNDRRLRFKDDLVSEVGEPIFKIGQNLVSSAPSALTVDVLRVNREIELTDRLDSQVFL